jgi:hypothetical protein
MLSLSNLGKAGRRTHFDKKRAVIGYDRERKRMRVWPMALMAAAAVLAACSASNSRGGTSNDSVRVLLSTDALLFGDFDADGDFSVTNAEIEAGVTREFARADSNRDNSIGPIEFQNWANQVLGGTMTPPYRLDFDRNVDNSISAEEFRDEILARARAYDSDENGVVTRAELVRQVNQARPAPRRPAPEPGAPADNTLSQIKSSSTQTASAAPACLARNLSADEASSAVFVSAGRNLLQRRPKVETEPLYSPKDGSGACGWFVVR